MVVSFGHSRVVHERIVRVLQSEGIEVVCFEEVAPFSDFLANPVAVVSLVIFSDTDGLNADRTLLPEVVRLSGDVPVLICSRDTGSKGIVEAMKAGASHYLAEPFTPAELVAALSHLAGREFDVRPADQSASPGPVRTNWEQRISPLLEKLRRVDTPLLIHGETGVGKENLALSIHANSLRAGKVFLKVNCAALPAELVESELFGYERGAFTGAFRSNRGKFEAANGGAILLDEIGDMDLKVQAKLLQVLQDHEFIPLGARHPVKVDIRVMAATHRNLERFVEEGKFRDDLYYRLNVINITIPPLRDRLDEIPRLVEHFLVKHASGDAPPPVTPQLLNAMRAYHWPGNLRELENMMRRYLVLHDDASIIADLRSRSARDSQSAGTQVSVPETGFLSKPQPQVEGPELVVPTPESLPARSANSDNRGGGPSQDLMDIEIQRRRAEAEVILQTLNATLWNRKEAAACLNIEYKALLYKMKKLNIGIKPPQAEQVNVMRAAT